MLHDIPILPWTLIILQIDYTHELIGVLTTQAARETNIGGIFMYNKYNRHHTFFIKPNINE